MKTKKIMIALMLLTTGTAWAEDFPKDSLKIVDIEEVVVIATPKENRKLRDLPVAATVLSHRPVPGAVRSQLWTGNRDWAACCSNAATRALEPVGRGWNMRTAFWSPFRRRRHLSPIPPFCLWKNRKLPDCPEDGSWHFPA